MAYTRKQVLDGRKVIVALLPKRGDVRRGRDIGFRDVAHQFMWLPCRDCGKERWFVLRTGKPRYPQYCGSCARKRVQKKGKDSPNWKGGRYITSQGYVLVSLSPDDFFYAMTDRRGWILEHRLIVAKALGRCLHLWEIIHHKKGFAKNDNRYPETLELYSIDRHNQMTILEHKIDFQAQRIMKLEAELTLLRSELEANYAIR